VTSLRDCARKEHATQGMLSVTPLVRLCARGCAHVRTCACMHLHVWDTMCRHAGMCTHMRMQASSSCISGCLE